MKNLFSRPRRLLKIVRVMLRHRLDEHLCELPRLSPVKSVAKRLPKSLRAEEDISLGVSIRRTLEDLGPVFVKFGQVLSTRRDMLPDDVASELVKLQDKVPAFPAEQARAVIEEQLGQSIEQLFPVFDDEPLASASIAQVHAAELPDGQRVIVKVVRPGIDVTIRQDIKLMFMLARLLQLLSRTGKRLRPVEVVEEYEKTIIDELDMQREAANASQLRRNFTDSPDLYIPEVYWPCCTTSVLVIERIEGIPGGDIAELHARGTNMKHLAKLGVDIFFTQVLRHNFFHADMHPGNVFVDATNPDKPHYISVDFGIVGSLERQDQRYLAENLHAFFNRDYKRVAEVHIESGWIKPGTSVNEFEAAIRTVCEPIFQLPIKDISYGKLLLRLFQTARRFEMEVQPQLVLLQKTLLNIEGMGRELYPDLDLWSTAKPFLDRWMDEQVGIRALFSGAEKNLPRFIEQIQDMPVTANDLILQLHQDVSNKNTLAVQQAKRGNLESRRLLQQLTGATFFIGGVLLQIAPSLSGFWTLFSWFLLTLGGAVMLHAVFAARIPQR